jgi:hypothetical protein
MNLRIASKAAAIKMQTCGGEKSDDSGKMVKNF